MIITRKGEKATRIFSVRLCCVCKRMFCLNDNGFVQFAQEGMVFFAHHKCPPQKPEVKLLGG